MSKKIKLEEVKKTPLFSFAVDGEMSKKTADALLDIICSFLDSHDCSFVGSMRLLTEEELAKETEKELENL
jgi:hypothetical protein